MDFVKIMGPVLAVLIAFCLVKAGYDGKLSKSNENHVQNLLVCLSMQTMFVACVILFIYSIDAIEIIYCVLALIVSFVWPLLGYFLWKRRTSQ